MKKSFSIFMLSMIGLLCMLPFIGGCQEFDVKSWEEFISSRPKSPKPLVGTGSTHTDTTPLLVPKNTYVATGFSIASGPAPKAVLRFSFSNDSIHTLYSNLDSAGIALSKEVQKILQQKLDEKQSRIDSLAGLLANIRKENQDTTPSDSTLYANQYMEFVQIGQPIKSRVDTISVRVICEQTSGSGWYSTEPVAKFRSVRMERQLEWRAAWNTGVTDYPITIGKTEWIPVSTRWIDPVAGCYQLIQLKE